jgi:hypothetical protein
VDDLLRLCLSVQLEFTAKQGTIFEGDEWNLQGKVANAFFSNSLTCVLVFVRPRPLGICVKLLQCSIHLRMKLFKVESVFCNEHH